MEIELLRSQAEMDNTLVFIGSHDNILDLLANQLHNSAPSSASPRPTLAPWAASWPSAEGKPISPAAICLMKKPGNTISPLSSGFSGMPLQLINLCYRQQGLIVAKNNPKNIKWFADMASRDFPLSIARAVREPVY